MEKDFFDAEEPTSSKAKASDSQPKKFDENIPVLPVNKSDGRYIPGEGLSFTSPLTQDERADVGSYYKSQNPHKLLSQQQSWYEQLGKLGGRVITNFVGDTIESFGSAAEIGEGIVKEMQGKDADFQNSVMDFGESLKAWGKKNMPIYQENPNENWNFSDSAWWFEGIESAFSTLSFLVGGLAATKGAGAIAKLTRAEQLLAKAGANVEKLKLGTKIATSAAFMRNAENMMESYQLRQNVKQTLLDEWKNDPKKFEDLVSGEVGQELADEGREVTPENLSNFIAGKAGWKAYAVNSINIVFDALQVAPIFKGFNAATRIGKFSTPSKVKAANRQLFNPNAKSASKLERALDYINPTVSGFGRSLSEGVEEAVNYIGTEEGQYLADNLSKNGDEKSFGKRMSKYLKSGDMYESAFWGTMGGALFEGAGSVAKKLSSKNIASNNTTDFRIAEIKQRATIIETASEDIKATTNDPDLSDDEKKKKIGMIKSSLSLDLGLRASQAGNVDLLIDQIQSPEFKQKMIDNGIADPIEVDKAIAKTVQDVRLSENLYKEYSNSFYSAKGSEQAKASLIRENVVTDFFIRKRQEKRTELATELENLKANDPYVKSSNLINLESLIQLESLKAAKRGLVEFMAQNQDDVLSERGKKELEKFDAQIASITEQVKDEKLDLSKINKDILAKNAEMILLEGVNNVEGDKLVDNRSQGAINKRDEEINEARANLRKELLNNFQQEVDRVAAQEGSVENLEKLKEQAKDDNDALKIVNDAISKAKDKAAQTQANTEATEATSNEETTEADKPFTPVKEATSVENDEFEGLPEYDIVDVDPSQVGPQWKAHIDKIVADRNVNEIVGVTGDELAAAKPLEVQYAKNSVQKIREEKRKKEDIAQLNTSVPTNKEIGFEMDEEAQVRKDYSQKKDKITIQDLQNPDRRSVDDLLDKDSIKSYHTDPFADPVTVYLPIFASKKYEDYYQFENGNILIRDEYIDIAKTLLSPEFNKGTEVEISWDKTNPKTQDRWKGVKDNEAFKISHNGKVLGYLGTVEGVEYEILKADREGRDEFADKLRIDLEQIKKIRNQLTLDDKIYYSKVQKKGNGTIISRGTRQTDLRSVEGIFNDFYALDPKNYIDNSTLVNIEKRDKTHGHKYALRPGIIYGLLNDANGQPIPTPLSVSKVNKQQAEELKNYITEILTLLNQGMHYSNPEVIVVKEKIEKYIKVDRSTNYDKAVGFRIYPKSTKPGKETEARIEMRYWSSKKNEMQTAVMKISQRHSGSWVGLFDGKGQPINPFENSTKKLTFEHPFFLDLLQRKYQNVDFRLLEANEAFEYNGKTYPSYKEYLIKEEVIQTDVAQVVDKSGNKISDLFGFKNDFKLYITATVSKESEKKEEEKLLATEIPSIKSNMIYFEELNLNEMKFDMNRLNDIENELERLYDLQGELKEEDDKFDESAGIKVGINDDHINNVEEQISLLESEKQRLTERWKFVSNFEAAILTEKDAFTKDQSFRKNYALFNNSTIDTATLLDDILKNPLNDNIKNVATFFKSNIHKITLPVVKAGKYDMDAYATVEHSAAHPEGRLLVNADMQLSEVYLQQSLLHELVHAATNSAIFNSLENPFAQFTLLQHKGKIDMSEVKFNKDAPKSIKDFVSFIVTERNHFINVFTKKYGKSLANLKSTTQFYGLSDPMEFIAEAMANPAFRNEIRSVDNSFFTKLYNAIVDLLNSVFKTNLSHRESRDLKRIVKTISNFIDAQSEINPIKVDPISLEVINTDTIKYDIRDEFSNEEINDTVNTLEGIILEAYRTNKITIDNTSTEISDRRDVYSKVREGYFDYVQNKCPESCKAKADQVASRFSELYELAISNLNRHFKLSTEDEISDLGDDGEINKEWDDKKHFSQSSQESVPNQIKMLIRSTPDLNSTNAQFIKGEPIWDAKKSSITGLTTYVDFNKVYPYLVRNIVGARTQNEIIERIDGMTKVHPSFAYVAYQLQNDANLLAQFETSLAKKHIYDSYVTFIRNTEGEKEIWTSNEMKATQYDYRISNKWNQKRNAAIDTKSSLEFQQAVSTFRLKIADKKDNLKDNIGELSIAIQDFANVIGIDLSIEAIQFQIESTTDWKNLDMVVTLGNIYKDTIEGKKNGNWARLNKLAGYESIVRFDAVENSGLDIKGNLIYAIRNPNFISNWFSDSRSKTDEGKQAFKDKLFKIAQVPKMQFSNWLWNDAGRKGLLNYEMVNNKRTATSVNWDFAKTFSFHNLGGAKELISKTAQDYSDFGDEDWMLINLINYIRPDDKAVSKPKEFALYPSLIPSDSSSMYSFEAPRIRLASGDFKKVDGKVIINPESKLFKAILDTNFQEIREIQQSTQRLFDIVEDKLVPKTDLDIHNLQQYYDYGKEIIYDEAGGIDWNKTLLTEDGSPKGQSMYFQNMIVYDKGKPITLNDWGVKRNGHIGVGAIGSVARDKIIEFTKIFAAQQIQFGVADYRSIAEKVQGKYGHISNGTFEGLITEYILNTYISNVEQFNFFNGDIGEYEDRISTNKRAKQMFAPGIALSPESMKMQYENGNYSDGVTFKGITMKDVRTKSSTTDFIVNHIKNGLVKEKPNKYTQSEIKDFSLKGKSVKNYSQLEKDVADIAAAYLKINAGDAQGYITLDRYEQILRGLGKITPEMEVLLDQARRGVLPHTAVLKAFPPVKGFYYGREYDVVNNRLYSSQIKYSSMPLIPQLTKGTELEKLMKWMNKTNTEESFFQSAHKVGARNINKVFKEDGSIDEAILNKAQSGTYYNRNWQLQLEVPEHIIDDENRLGTQITKLIVANLDPSATYNINGKSYTKDKLLEHYFNTLGDNILESAEDLVKMLGVEKEKLSNGEESWIIRDKDIQQVLIDEVERRGLSQNYRYAIEIGEDGNFKLPLFVNGMASKWEAILTSLFTNRIVRQKLPGGNLALGSRLGIDTAKTQSEVKFEDFNKNDIEGARRFLKYKDRKEIIDNYWEDNHLDSFIGNNMQTEAAPENYIEFANIKQIREVAKKLIADYEAATPKESGIEWSKEKADDKTLKAYREGPNEETLVVEVLLSAWSSQLFNKEGRLKIDEIPDEIKTMVGYRIPTTDKAYMTVFKVVGFLPEGSRGMIITPDDMVVQMGQDFDIDKWYINRKNFYLDKDSKFVVPNIHTEKAEFKNLEKQIKEIQEELGPDSLYSDSDVASTKLISDIFGIDLKSETNFLRAKLKMLNRRIKSLSKENSEFKTGGTKYARQNEIVSIWQEILTHPAHIKEVLTPSGYPTITETATLIDKIFGVSDKNLPVTTEAGQRAFRKRNLTGKSLVAIAANLNAFGAIAQVTQMKLNQKLAFAVSLDLNKYKESELKSKYGLDYIGNGTVLFRNLGFAPDGSYLNINNDPILVKGSEGVVAFVDNAKDPKADKINLTPYTYPTYHSGVLAGVDPVTMGLFMRQPIIKMLNDYYFNNKSLLGDNIGNQIEIIKKFYQTALYEELNNQGKAKENPKFKRVLDKRKDDNVTNSYDDRYLIFLKRVDTKEVLGYDPDNIPAFSQEELESQLYKRAEGYNKLDADGKVDYLRKQLQYIEIFNKWKKTGELVQDVLRVTKTDTTGAGPSMEITNSLIRGINALKDNKGITIDDQPAVRKIYPSHFGVNEKSAYPALESYLNHANKLSVSILRNLFINQSDSYKNVSYTVNGLSKPETPEKKEFIYRNVNKYLNGSILQDFAPFKKANKVDTLGIGKDFKSNVEVDYDTFKGLSAANKVFIMQAKMREHLQKDSQNILNFVEAVVDKEQMAKNGYHKIGVVFYNNEYTDDNLVRSMLDMYESEDKFQKDLAESLILYSFVADSLSYGLESFAKIVPNKILHDMGLGTYLRDVHLTAKHIDIFGMSSVDKFYRNNHTNDSIVPVVRTRWDFISPETIDLVKQMIAEGKTRLEIVKKTGLTDHNVFDIEQGRSNIIRKDRDGDRQTKDNSPIWNTKEDIWIINEKSLKTSNDNIINAPYVVSYNKDGNSFLYKKYIVENVGENGGVVWDTSFDGNVYYYKISKLGKDGIFEYTDSSIFQENNTEKAEKVLKGEVEATIEKIHQKRVAEALIVANTPKDKQEDIKKDCGYGN